MLPAEWQDATLAAHGDLYRRHPAGFAALDIRGGTLALGTAIAAPFGVAPMLEVAGFTPLEIAGVPRLS
jgi:hypothetical protein